MARCSFEGHAGWRKAFVPERGCDSTVDFDPPGAASSEHCNDFGKIAAASRARLGMALPFAGRDRRAGAENCLAMSFAKCSRCGLAGKNHFAMADFAARPGLDAL